MIDAASTSGSARGSCAESSSTILIFFGFSAMSSGVAFTPFAPTPGFSLITPYFCNSSSARLPFDGSFWIPTFAPTGKSLSDLIFFE